MRGRTWINVERVARYIDRIILRKSRHGKIHGDKRTEKEKRNTKKHIVKSTEIMNGQGREYGNKRIRIKQQRKNVVDAHARSVHLVILRPNR